MRVFSRIRWWCTALGEEQRGDGRVDLVGIAVRQNDDAGSVLDGLADLRADAVEGPLEGQPAAGHPVQTGDDDGLEAGQVTVQVDVDDLGQVVVADDRERQDHLAAARRPRTQQVALGTDGRAERGDQLLADGIERWVGDLGEELLKVVEQQPGAVRQHGDRRVRAHRADGLVPHLGHGGDDDLELFVGVPEHLLAPAHALVAVHDVFAVGQAAQVDDPRVQPVLVGVLGRQLGLDLLVVDDAALRGVDQQHLPRLQAALLDHVGLVHVDDAHLGRHDHQVVVGDPIAAGPQAVAVEDGADHRAVREGHRGRPVPGLHERGVEPVEGPLGRIHLLVVLPRLRDHHQHGVGQRPTAQVQQLEDLVEAGRVRCPGRADRIGPAEVARDDICGQEGLPGPHPVAVALDRVDLPVVGDEAVGVGEGPGREGVGGEPAVDQCQRGLHPLVAEVGVEGSQLRRGQHALVDERAGRQRREVRAAAVMRAGLVLDALAQEVDASIEVDAARACRIAHEELAEHGHDLAGGRPQHVRLDGDVAPAQRGEAFLGHERLDGGHGLLPLDVVLGQEAGADGVLAHGREAEAGYLPQEPVRDLEQDAGPVTGVGLGSRRPSVLQVAERTHGELDDPPGGAPLDVHDERNTAGVVFEPRVVEPGRARLPGAHHPHPRSRDPAGSAGWMPGRRWPDSGTTLAEPSP